MRATKPAAASQFSRALSGPAAAYLAQIREHLHDLDRRLRSQLLAVAADNLAERPGAASFRDLLEDLGGPHDYARMLRDEAEVADSGALDRSRRRRRAQQWWTAVIIIAVIAAGVAVGTWWVRWHADIQSNSWRVCTDAATLADEDCSQAGVQQIALSNSTIVACHGTISVSADLHAERDITVTGVSLNGVATPADDPPLGPDSGPLPWLTVVETQVWQNSGGGAGGDVTAPEWNPIRTGWPLTVGRYPTDTFVTFVITACPAGSHAQPGGYVGIESMQVRYHARGLDRVMTVSLPQALLFGA